MTSKTFFVSCIIVLSTSLAYSQTPDILSKNVFNVTFRLDASSELKKLKSLSSIGIRGNKPPLSWEKTYLMTTKGNSGLFEANIPFAETEDPLLIRYKYYYGTSSWETSEDRVLRLKNERIVLPVDLWNIVSLVNTAAFQDSMEARELYNKIISLDSLVFTAYNNCDLDLYGSLFSEDLEFYHDKGGLSNTRKTMVESVKNHICGKVRRELVRGSIEVSPIPGYGAVEMGEHRFYNIKEKSLSGPGKFIIIWRNKNGKWEATRVISLH